MLHWKSRSTEMGRAFASWVVCMMEGRKSQYWESFELCLLVKNSKYICLTGTENIIDEERQRRSRLFIYFF